MFIAYVVVAVVLAVVLVFSGRAKLVKDERVTKGLTAAGVPQKWYPYLATVEFAGALGLIAGIVLAPLGIAAAIGVVLYFVGASTAHVRTRDFSGLTAPIPLLVVGALALVFRLAAH